MSERELVAERTIYAIDKDSRGFEIQLTVGKPYQISQTEWACPVAMIGLHGVIPDMHGVDSWQALTVSLKLIGDILAYFVEDGGRLFWEKDGDELMVNELFDPLDETSEPDGPMTEEQLKLSAKDQRLNDQDE